MKADVAEQVPNVLSMVAEETGERVGTPIPLLVWRAIRSAASGEVGFSLACRLFVEDVSDSCPCREGGIRAARLEHAVARAVLDAWRRGQASCESVGAAYAAAGELMT